MSLQCAVPFAVHPPDSHLPDPHGDLAGLLLDGHLRRLARLRNPIEWRIARVLERLESGAGYLELGFARLSDYARERLGLPPRRVQTLVGLARRLAPLPRVAAAFEFGVLSQSQAALVARVATPLDEAPWVARAAARTVRRLSDEVREAVAGMTAMAAMAAPERQAAVVDENAAALCETDEPGQIVGFTAPARLRPLWDEALELARRSSGASDPVYQGVEFIAADFLAGAPDLPRLLAEVVRSSEVRCGGEGRGPAADENGHAAVERRDAEPDGTNLFEEILRAREAEPRGSEGIPADDAPAVALPDATFDRPDDTPRRLDQRLRALTALRQKLAWQQGRLLGIMARRRLYRDLGFLSFSRYCTERAGLGARRAWQLIALDRRLMSLPRVAAAYRAGELSWVRASAIARVATERTEADWIRLAQSVTVRRLHDEVAMAIAAGEVAHRDAVSPGGVRPPGLGPDGRVQLSAPRHSGEMGQRAMGLPEAGSARAHIRFWAPLEIAALWRQAIAVSRLLLLCETPASGLAAEPASEPAAKPAEWECAERILQTFVAGWSIRQTPAWQRRYRIFERDGWRCRVPGCTSRTSLQVHHVVFRSQGGGDEDANLAVLCATHHMRSIHLGRLRCHALPDGLLAWEFAPDPLGAPLARFVEDVTWDTAVAASGAGAR